MTNNEDIIGFIMKVIKPWKEQRDFNRALLLDEIKWHSFITPSEDSLFSNPVLETQFSYFE